MTKLGRDMRLAKLQKWFAAVADPLEFCELVWAGSMLQGGEVQAARQLVNVPTNIDVFERLLAPFTLETLFTLYLLTPPKRDPRGRYTNCKEIATLAVMAGLLNKLENSEVGMYLNQDNVLDELPRIAYRQFHWQRGYHNVANYYRSAFIYGQGQCAEAFEKAYGFSISDFTLAAFAAMSQARQARRLTRQIDFSEAGLSREVMAKTYGRIAAPIEKLRGLAPGKFAPHYPVAYQMSLLRDFPLVEFEPGYVAPIPVLIQVRTTVGLYYDLVSLGGRINEEIGKRFETYAHDLIEAMIAPYEVAREYRYGPKSASNDTPDILIRKDGVLELIIECKSKKLSFEDQYGTDRWKSQGFSEVVRGVYQVWKFASHVRRGIAVRPDGSQERAAADLRGVVLTLHGWGVMSLEVLRVAHSRARALCKPDDGIEEEDRIPVALVSIEELESTAERAEPDVLLSAIKEASELEEGGKMLSARLLEGNRKTESLRPYPFVDRMAEVLPWWTRFGDSVGDRRDIGGS
jgi:hypothetical protein